MNAEREFVITRLMQANSAVSAYIGRLVAEGDPGSTTEYTRPLGRETHLLTLELLAAVQALATFERLVDFGVETDPEAPDPDDDVPPDHTAAVQEGIAALRRNPFLSTEVVNDLFGDGTDLLPGTVTSVTRHRTPKTEL